METSRPKFNSPGVSEVETAPQLHSSEVESAPQLHSSEVETAPQLHLLLWMWSGPVHGNVIAILLKYSVLTICILTKNLKYVFHHFSSLLSVLSAVC